MGIAGSVLKHILYTYEIEPRQFATEMGIPFAILKNWLEEVRDPYSEQVRAIAIVLHRFNPEAAKSFKKLYWNSP